MNYNKQTGELKSSAIFFIKFLVLFLVLNSFFPFYWGVIGPGGKLFSPFLANYFNFIKGFSAFITSSSTFLLNAAGYTTTQNAYNVLRIESSRGVIVNPSCLGWGVMSFWVALVYANSVEWKNRIKWMLYGIAIITLLNIFRIALIVLANHHKWHMITRLDHHQTFNIMSYCCIFVLMFWYVTLEKKHDKTVMNVPHAKDRFSTV